MADRLMIWPITQLLRWMNYRNGSKWTHFIEKGAIVSYNAFHFNAQHSRAQYQDGKGR